MPIPNINKQLVPEDIPEEILEDFRNHLFMCMKYLGLGEPTPLQYLMADRLQNGGEEFQLQAGRGAGKSVLTLCVRQLASAQGPEPYHYGLVRYGN